MAYRAFSRLSVKAARYCGHQGPRFPITGRFPSSTAPCFASFSTLTRHGSTSTDTGSTNRPRAVIFDVGGVVVPSPFPVFARFEREQGLSAGSVIHTIKETGGEGAWAKLERGEITVGEFGEPFSKEYESITGRAVPAEVFRKFLEGFRVGKQVTVTPLMVEVMEKLRSLGVKTAVLTNNFRYDDGGTLRPQENLNVDVVIESCVEGSRKPEISIYQETLRRLAVEASETVFLDDIGSNLKTARDLGMATIKVEDLSDALGVLEELLKLGPLASGVRVTGTSEVDPKLVFPVEGLAAYLREKHGLEADEPPLIRQFRHGQSNPTYYIQYAGAQLVLRKKPPGKLLPSAHAVEREYRVMKATREAGVPIPPLLSLCEDDSVIGTPFYIMQYVPGRVLKDPALPDLQLSQRKTIYGEMVRVLASIHSVDIDRAGLNDFGKHGNYLQRQVSRWSQQYAFSETHTIPAMDSLMSWLNSTTLPPGRTSIVHGDYRLDNLIYGGELSEVVAVLDWELSTLGDPVSDLAYVCMPYHMDPDQPQLKGLVGLDLGELGIPSEDEVMEEYCRQCPHSMDDLSSSWSVYQAFTFFRVAAILQGVYKRALQKQSSASNAETVGLMAEDFAKKGWQFAQRQQQSFQSTGHSPRPATTPRQFSTIAATPPSQSTANRSRLANTYSYSCGANNGPLMALITGDAASFPPRLRELRKSLVDFIGEHIVPNERAVLDHQLSGDRWTPLPLIGQMKSEARSRGLWNLFLPLESDPGSRYGAGLSNLEYAHLAEMMGHYLFASEVFNCSAPDTGNMEVLVKYGTGQQKEEWLHPLLAGEMRSCFAMTEPAVASSDATNIQSSIVRDGDSYVINGHKWWISGAMDPRCKICIFMGKTDPDAPRHEQQSMILVPMDSPGVRVLRPLTVFGYDDAPSGHAEMEFSDVRVPTENLLLGEGRGFEIAQGRLGPGRTHHCMRLIGMAERALGLVNARVQERVAFGKTLAEQGTVLNDIAQSRIEIEQARLLTLKAAHKMDTVGNKAAREDIAMIKVVAPQMVQRVVDRAIQAHGAMGLSGDRPLAQFFSLARILRLADGPDEVHAAALGKMELRKNQR